MAALDLPGIRPRPAGPLGLGRPRRQIGQTFPEVAPANWMALSTCRKGILLLTFLPSIVTALDQNGLIHLDDDFPQRNTNPKLQIAFPFWFPRRCRRRPGPG